MKSLRSVATFSKVLANEAISICLIIPRMLTNKLEVATMSILISDLIISPMLGL